MADRKAELERKKAKLQALREEKQRRQKEREQQEVTTNEHPPQTLLGFRRINPVELEHERALCKS